MDCGRIAHRGRHVDLMSHNEQYVSLIRKFLNEDNENNLDQSSDDYGSAESVYSRLLRFSLIYVRY